MKIYDCFIFFDEELVLDVRLNCLNKFVDKFVIVESVYSHRGEKRKPTFDIKKFSKFKDKITYILLEDLPSNILKIKINDKKANEKIIINGNIREFYQRNAILKYKNDYDYLLWIDADCVFNNVPDRNFYNLIKTTIKDNMLGFMRRPTYSECGFMIFNLKHKYLLEYYKDVSNIWLSNDIYYTQQNHDSFIMDLIRERLEKKYKTILHVDIASYGKDKGIEMHGDGHILELTPFIYYFYHHKGSRKFLTLDEKKLVNKNFT